MIYANGHRGDYPRHVSALTNCLVKYLGLDPTDLYFHRVRIAAPNVWMNSLSSVKVRSHWTSAFASNFNHVSMETLALMQMMGAGPLPCVCILLPLLPPLFTKMQTLTLSVNGSLKLTIFLNFFTVCIFLEVNLGGILPFSFISRKISVCGKSDHFPVICWTEPLETWCI